MIWRDDLDPARAVLLWGAICIMLWLAIGRLLGWW
jgi:hypothetical protein